MIISQGFPLGAIAPDGTEYLVIGWWVDEVTARGAAFEHGALAPRAILAGTAESLGAGWRLTWEIPIPWRPRLEGS